MLRIPITIYGQRNVLKSWPIINLLRDRTVTQILAEESNSLLVRVWISINFSAVVGFSSVFFNTVQDYLMVHLDYNFLKHFELFGLIQDLWSLGKNKEIIKLFKNNIKWLLMVNIKVTSFRWLVFEFPEKSWKLKWDTLSMMKVHNIH